MASVLQEVFDRPGWVADNALVAICTSTSVANYTFLIWSYDGNPSLAPKLEIRYW